MIRPDLFVKSLEEIDFNKLLVEGYECFLFDFDNTITAWREKAIPERNKVILLDLSKRALVVIVSNGKRKDVDLPVEAIWRAGKPFSLKVLRFLKKRNLKPEKCVIVGDQLFTDVLMGKLFGFYTVKVEPISEREFVGTKFLRLLEKIVRRFSNENR